MQTLTQQNSGGVQLPDGAKQIGYRRSRTNRFEFDTIYQCGEITGTERDLVDAGMAYRYRRIGKFTVIAY